MSKKKRELDLLTQATEGLKEHIHAHSNESAGVPQTWGKPKIKDLQLEDCRHLIEQVILFLKGDVVVNGGVNLKSSGELNINMKLKGETIVITFNDPEPRVAVSYIINFESKIPEINANVEEVNIDLKGILIPNPKFKVVS